MIFEQVHGKIKKSLPWGKPDEMYPYEGSSESLWKCALSETRAWI